MTDCDKTRDRNDANCVPLRGAGMMRDYGELFTLNFSLSIHIAVAKKTHVLNTPHNEAIPRKMQ